MEVREEDGGDRGRLVEEESELLIRLLLCFKTGLESGLSEELLDSFSPSKEFLPELKRLLESG